MYRPPLWYLQKVDLFANMTNEQIMETVEGMQDHSYEVKSILYSPEDHVDHTYVLKEGEVTLYRSVDGKRVVLDILKPGAIFGNILCNEMDDCADEGHYAEITQDAYICTLPRDFFLQLIQRRPDIALNAIKSMNKRIAQYQAQLGLLPVLNARQRVLTMIDMLNRKDAGSILPEILRRPIKITHEKLANMTGLTRETVTKQLQELQKDGLIMTEKKNIQLTDTGKQEAMKIAVGG